MVIVKWGLIVIVVLVALVVLIGVMLSPTYHVERSVVVDATPEQVHALVGDLARWEEWTPWKDIDPQVKTTLGEQTTGVGASQTWTDKDGSGWLKLTRSDPDSGVAYDMAFVMGEDDEMPAQGAINYQAVDGRTRVSWSMSGEVTLPVFGGYLAKMLPGQVGPMFDQGLAKLKTAAEAEPIPAPDEEEIEEGAQGEPSARRFQVGERPAIVAPQPS